jgi:hypothetical protein
MRLEGQFPELMPFRDYFVNGLRCHLWTYGLQPPFLVAATPAVPLLDESAVLRTYVFDVQALVCELNADLIVTAPYVLQPPFLVAATPAVPLLDESAVLRTYVLDVQALVCELNADLIVLCLRLFRAGPACNR